MLISEGFLPIYIRLSCTANFGNRFGERLEERFGEFFDGYRNGCERGFGRRTAAMAVITGCHYWL